jgi:hypothetical protein
MMKKPKGRPAGSKNRAPSVTREMAFLKKMPKEIRGEVLDLSVRSGINIYDICVDAMREGLTCCKTDGYAELIRFRKNAGKLIKENETSNQGMAESANPYFQDAEPEEATPQTGLFVGRSGDRDVVDADVGFFEESATPVGFDDAVKLRGYEAETVQTASGDQGENGRPDVEQEESGQPVHNAV